MLSVCWLVSLFVYFCVGLFVCSLGCSFTYLACFFDYAFFCFFGCFCVFVFVCCLRGDVLSCWCVYVFRCVLIGLLVCFLCCLVACSFSCLFVVLLRCPLFLFIGVCLGWLNCLFAYALV